MPDITAEQAERAIRAAAFHINDTKSADRDRTLIHCFRGFMGADWDVEHAVGLLGTARRIHWRWSILCHELIVVDADGNEYQFDARYDEHGRPTQGE